MTSPSAPAPAPIPAAPRRFRAADVGLLLDMQTLGEVLAGVTLTGWRQVAGNLLADRSGHRAALTNALRQQNTGDALGAADSLEALRLRAHALKGNAASLGLRGVQQAAAEVERQWKEQGRTASLGPTEAAAALDEAWEGTRGLLERMGLLTPGG